MRQEFPPPVLQALEELITNPPPDPDESRRLDLRGHKVYTIDSSDTVEVSPPAPQLSRPIWPQCQLARGVAVRVRFGSEGGRKGESPHRGRCRNEGEAELPPVASVQVDDGLSVETLPDGRRRVWIHVADPTRWLQPHDLLDM